MAECLRLTSILTRRSSFAMAVPRDGYLLQVACVQAFLFAAADVSHAVLMTFYLRQYPIYLLVWTSASLWFELDQIDGRPTTRAGSSASQIGIWLAKIRSYVRQDFFNTLDFLALMLAEIAAIYAVYLMRVSQHSQWLSEAVTATFETVNENQSWAWVE